MNVRQAKEEDIADIIRMGRVFWSQTEHSDIPYCPDSIAIDARYMIAQNLLLVAEHEGKVIGAVGAVAYPLYANMAYVFATERFWYVEPEYRNSGAGQLMMAGIESACRAVGVHKFSMVCLEAVEPDKVSALYVRAGYTLTERNFIKRL